MKDRTIAIRGSSYCTMLRYLHLRAGPGWSEPELRYWRYGFRIVVVKRKKP